MVHPREWYSVPARIRRHDEPLLQQDEYIAPVISSQPRFQSPDDGDTHHLDLDLLVAGRQILQRLEEIRFGRSRVFPPGDQEAHVYLTLDRRCP